MPTPSNLDKELKANGATPLMEAIVRGDNVGISQLLLVFDKNDLNEKDKLGNTALMYAAGSHDNGPLIDRLIQEGADPDIRNVAGYTPLIIAASRGHERCVQSLLKGGANPYLQAGLITPELAARNYEFPFNNNTSDKIIHEINAVRGGSEAEFLASKRATRDEALIADLDKRVTHDETDIAHLNDRLAKHTAPVLSNSQHFEERVPFLPGREKATSGMGGRTEQHHAPDTQHGHPVPSKNHPIPSLSGVPGMSA